MRINQWHILMYVGTHSKHASTPVSNKWTYGFSLGDTESRIAVNNFSYQINYYCSWAWTGNRGGSFRR